MYDIFVGSTLPVLAAAAALSQRGRPVVVLLPAIDSTPDLPSPSLNFSLGPAWVMGMERFFCRLGVPKERFEAEGLTLRRCVPLLQIVQSQCRMDLNLEEGAYLKALQGEFKDQGSNLKSLWLETRKEAELFRRYQAQGSLILPRTHRLKSFGEAVLFRLRVGLQNNQSALALLDRFYLSEAVIEHFNLLSLFVFGKRLSLISKFQWVGLFLELSDAGEQVTGGYPPVRAFFIKRICEWGGAVRSAQEIKSLNFEKNRLTGVTFANDAVLPCRNVVMSQPWEGRRMTFYFAIQKEFIPSLMKENVVMTWGKTVPDAVENILILRLSSPEEEKKQGVRPLREARPLRETRPPRATRRLAVTVLIQEDAQISAEFVKDLETQILNRLHWLMPFSGAALQKIGEPSHRDDALTPHLSRALGEKTTRFAPPLFHYRKSKTVLNGTLAEEGFVEGMGQERIFQEAMSMAEILEKS